MIRTFRLAQDATGLIGTGGIHVASHPQDRVDRTDCHQPVPRNLRVKEMSKNPEYPERFSLPTCETLIPVTTIRHQSLYRCPPLRLHQHRLQYQIESTDYAAAPSSSILPMYPAQMVPSIFVIRCPRAPIRPSSSPAGSDQSRSFGHTDPRSSIYLACRLPR